MNHKSHKKINYGYYAALVVGIMALLVLVGVYTTTQNLSKDEQFVDLNGDRDGLASDAGEDETAQVGVQVADASGEKSDSSIASNASDGQQMANADSSNTDDIGKADLVKADITTAETATTEADNNASGDADTKTDQDTEETSASATSSFTKNSTMSWPVQGNVILPYSMDTTVYYKTLDTYKCNPGMLISAKKGTAVYSSYAGTVLSIDNTSEYGNTVTVDLGNGYHAIYGQLADISVTNGQPVEAGAALGTVAKATSMYSLEGNHLYFAMTKDDSPVNPEAFLQ